MCPRSLSLVFKERTMVAVNTYGWTFERSEFSFAASLNCCGSGRSSETEKADRKSTRLNSSHDQISYAVFCLKKKKKKKTDMICYYQHRNQVNKYKTHEGNTSRQRS